MWYFYLFWKFWIMYLLWKQILLYFDPNQLWGHFNTFSKCGCIEHLLLSEFRSCVTSTLTHVTVIGLLLLSPLSHCYLAVFMMSESRVLYISISTSQLSKPSATCHLAKRTFWATVVYPKVVNVRIERLRVNVSF